MKKSIKIKTFIALIVLAIFGVTSCSESNDPYVTPVPTAPAADNTIVGKAVATPSLSILVAALTKAELVGVLKGTGPFTVFAPTNDAFTAANISVASINALSTPTEIATLKQVLLNHVISGSKTTAAQLTDNTYLGTTATYAATTNKLSMFVAKTAAGAVKLNGVSSVTTADTEASNGIIHIVDKVIGLPTIATHAAANPAFSILFKAVTSTVANGNGFGDQSAVATFLTTNTTPLTVFAPTDAAFAAATAAANGTTPAAWANGATPTQVTKVLQYHVTDGNILSTSLTQAQVIPMKTSPVLNTTIDLVSGAKIKDTQNISASIIATNVQCVNGIIHGIDKVLRPF